MYNHKLSSEASYSSLLPTIDKILLFLTQISEYETKSKNRPNLCTTILLLYHIIERGERARPAQNLYLLQFFMVWPLLLVLFKICQTHVKLTLDIAKNIAGPIGQLV